MNREIERNFSSKPNNEEVDLIKLLNYFKNGIKSFFRLIGKCIESIIHLIILLKKNWIIIVALTILGAIYGWYMLSGGKENKKYEMVVKTNPISNIELYSLAEKFDNEINSSNNEVKNIGIKSMQVDAIEMNEDIIGNYFNQVEGTSFRTDQTDTLYFKSFELKGHKGQMTKYDFAYQKVKFSADAKSNPKSIESKFLEYVNNLPGVKREQESRLQSLIIYENSLKRNLDNIDSLLVARAIANRNATAASNEQVLVSTTSRANVEADLLRYSEIFTRKLFGTQKLIAENQKGVQIVSQLKLTSDNSGLNNPIIKYSLIGFILSCLVVLLIQFNNYLNKYSAKRGL